MRRKTTWRVSHAVSNGNFIAKNFSLRLWVGNECHLAWLVLFSHSKHGLNRGNKQLTNFNNSAIYDCNCIREVHSTGELWDRQINNLLIDMNNNSRGRIGKMLLNLIWISLSVIMQLIRD